ncbi:MAG: hypothetical protein HOH95_10445 [Dehalococcoidia bacterium]|jgi:hypothetical protein|nr:hypothetical protein [Dehalococcoidia bacterium]
MKANDRFGRWFGWTVVAGVLANTAVAAVGIFNPGPLVELLDLEHPEPDFWLRLSAWLLFLLSLTYLAAAQDPYRSRYMSWLTVGCRWGGVTFVTSVVYALDLDKNYLAFALFDLVFAIPETLFLVLGFRAAAMVER